MKSFSKESTSLELEQPKTKSPWIHAKKNDSADDTHLGLRSFLGAEKRGSRTRGGTARRAEGNHRGHSKEESGGGRELHRGGGWFGWFWCKERPKKKSEVVTTGREAFGFFCSSGLMGDGQGANTYACAFVCGCDCVGCGEATNARRNRSRKNQIWLEPRL